MMCKHQELWLPLAMNNTLCSLNRVTFLPVNLYRQKRSNKSWEHQVNGVSLPESNGDCITYRLLYSLMCLFRSAEL